MVTLNKDITSITNFNVFIIYVGVIWQGESQVDEVKSF